MEAVSEFADMKAQLEAKVAGLERERATLQKEVKSLSERLAIKQLEREAGSLEGEVNALRAQKTALQQKLATHDASQAQTAPPQQRPPVRPVGQ